MSKKATTEKSVKSAWAVVFVDIGEGFDSHPEVLSVHKTYEQALKALREDMRYMQKQHGDEYVYDFDGFEVRGNDDVDYLCAYNIVEIKLP